MRKRDDYKFNMIMNALSPDYLTYTRSVSDSGTAMSVQAIRAVMEAMFEDHPRIVADLGSGFSSVALRMYKKMIAPRTEVYSVDTELAWLEKTKTFLQERELPVCNMLLWDDFKHLNPKSIDVIIMDLGCSNGRGQYYDLILRKHIYPGTLLFIDDCHKGHIVADAKHKLKELCESFKWISLKDKTLDDKDRWMSMVTNILVRSEFMR